MDPEIDPVKRSHTCRFEPVGHQSFLPVIAGQAQTLIYRSAMRLEKRGDGLTRYMDYLLSLTFQ